MFTLKLINCAYDKVCFKRRNSSSDDDIWDLRFRWNDRKLKLLNELNSGKYRFDAVKEICIDSQVYEKWIAEDAVVIEALTQLLKDKYKIVKNCSSYHLKGRGGVKGAVRRIMRNAADYKYVFRTDVRKYYASIDHLKLFEILRKYITETNLLLLLYSFLKKTNYKNGYYLSVNKGICCGSALSPILGALYLEELDRELTKDSPFYIRYMDDIVIFDNNKYRFRRNIKKVNRILEKLKLNKAPDKTFIGKIEKGFDFLGFYFGRSGISVSKKSIIKFAENIVMRLTSHSSSAESKITPFSRARYGESSSDYVAEQLKVKNKMKGDLPIPETVSLYIRRWLTWVKSIYGKKEFQVRSAKFAQ